MMPEPGEYTVYRVKEPFHEGGPITVDTTTARVTKKRVLLEDRLPAWGFRLDVPWSECARSVHSALVQFAMQQEESASRLTSKAEHALRLAKKARLLAAKENDASQ